MVIRVRKQDSAYFYQLLESYEGITSYSTVTSDRNLAYRDIRLYQKQLARERDRVNELTDALTTVFSRCENWTDIDCRAFIAGVMEMTVEEMEATISENR
jgi:hypothetical protein